MAAVARRRLALAIVLALGAAGGGAYYMFRPGAPSPPEVEVPADDPELVKAVNEARSDVEKHPNSPDAWGKLGMVFAVHIYADEALSCFEQAERLAPSDRRWVYHQGLLLYSCDPAAAVPKFRQAAGMGRSEVIRLRLAEALVTMGRFDEAEPEFLELVKATPNHPRALLGLARIALDRNDLSGCEQHLAAAADDPRARRGLAATWAELRHRQGDAPAAAAAQQRASEIAKDVAWPDPDVEALAKLMTGLTARSQIIDELIVAGRYDEADRLLRDYLKARPYSTKHRLLLGFVLIERRDWTGMEEAMAEAVRDAKEAPRAHLYLGIARFNRGRHAEAAESFRKAIELKPDYTAAHANLAACLKESGDCVGAAKALRGAIATQPQNASLYVSLAEVLIADGRRAEAAEVLKEALALEPGHAKAKELFVGVK